MTSAPQIYSSHKNKFMKLGNGRFTVHFKSPNGEESQGMVNRGSMVEYLRPGFLASHPCICYDSEPAAQLATNSCKQVKQKVEQRQMVIARFTTRLLYR